MQEEEREALSNVPAVLAQSDINSTYLSTISPEADVYSSGPVRPANPRV